MVPSHHRSILASALLLTLVVSAGCVHAQAKTVGPDPVLTTPDPPARVLIPVPPESLVPPPTPTPEPTPTPAAGRPSTVTPPRPSPTPAATPLPENPAPPPPTVALLESQARERLDQAEKLIARVKRDTLSTDARDNYDSATRYIRLAHQAITERQYVYAKNCADKAAIIAGLLVRGISSSAPPTVPAAS